MGARIIVDPGKEILIVKYRGLNGTKGPVRQLVDEALALAPRCNGRKPIPCLEGDLVQVGKDGEVIWTHQSFFRPSQNKYQDLREAGKAFSLNEMLDQVATYMQEHPGQRLVLNIDLKHITSDATIETTVEALKSRKIEAFFDTQFGHRLDYVDGVNKRHGTDYVKCLHRWGNFGRWAFGFKGPKTGHDILGIPYTFSLGHPKVPVIYGAVSKIEKLDRLADDPLCYGVYDRFSEKGAFTMFYNSITNRK
ncbi:hypothetical protein ACFL0V_01550 [Nanoarchaeota archaeon]